MFCVLIVHIFTPWPTLFLYTSDYALQVRPVSFLQEPTSSAVLVGSSVTFACNVNIAPLISDYPLPNLTWRVNGSMDTSTQSSWQIRPNSSEDGYNYFSELYIESVSAEDAGYYECVSSDGGGRYVTISSRAWLTVICKCLVLILSAVVCVETAMFHVEEMVIQFNSWRLLDDLNYDWKPPISPCRGYVQTIAYRWQHWNVERCTWCTSND